MFHEVVLQTGCLIKDVSHNSTSTSIIYRSSSLKDVVDITDVDEDDRSGDLHGIAKGIRVLQASAARYRSFWGEFSYSVSLVPARRVKI